MAQTHLTREEMMEAVAAGARNGIIALGTDHGRLDIPHEIVHDAIRQGVRDAIWQMITNATSMPCSDFFEAVKEGVESGMVKLNSEDES